MQPVPFIDLEAQQERLGADLQAAVSRVMEHRKFIMGPEVGLLEERLSAYCSVSHAIGCSSGTDALLLGLMALEAGRGDAVLVPGFSFVAAAEVVALLGASPVFLDVDPDSCNMSPGGIADGVEVARSNGLSPVGIIAVDLFGRPADYDEIEKAASGHDLWLICDAAQSFGSVYRERRTGGMGKLTATSFYPAKPLGCYGDGGAVLTNDDDIASKVRSLLSHGQGANKYDNVRIGVNGRLDTIQAAILLEKLKIFPEELEARDIAANRYREAFSGIPAVLPPLVGNHVRSTWAQYTIQLEKMERTQFIAMLAEDGIPAVIHYPEPLHHQEAYRGFPVAERGLPVAASLCGRVLSLPMHAYLAEYTQERIISAVRRAVEYCGE